MKKTIFFFSLLCVWGFICLVPVKAETNTIIITEIAAYESSGHEWVEIYNRGTEPVDLVMWKFWEAGVNHGLTSVRGGSVLLPGAYGIIAQDAAQFDVDYPGTASFLMDSSWGTLNEAGELIGLKDSLSVLVEQFIYVAASDHSLERKNTSVDEYTNEHWIEHPSGHSAGSRNYWEIHTSESTPVLVTHPEERQVPQTGLVVINEMVVDPLDGEKEWVEFYNSDTHTIDLSSWTLEDGSGIIAHLSSTLAVNNFVTVELSGSRLNNGGDQLVLKNNGGHIVDAVQYGNWVGLRSGERNAPAPSKGQSIARVPNGQDTGDDKTDFLIVSSTKGVFNVQLQTSVSPVSEEGVVSSSSAQSSGSLSSTVHPLSYEPGDVVISEFVSDPSDGEEEFVELYNRFTQPISLVGWWIEDGSEAKTMLSGTISGDGWIVITSIKGNLNNAGDSITLFDPNGHEIDRVVYGNWDSGHVSENAPAPKDPLSAARASFGQDTDNDSRDFSLTERVTKGSRNVLLRSTISSPTASVVSSSFAINEVFPNPTGNDEEGEFIEICNTQSADESLLGWSIKNTSGKKYTFSSTTISAHLCRAFYRTETHIAFRNTGGDSVTLYTSTGQIADIVSYEDAAKEQFSYAKDDRLVWRWTTTPTPSTINVITEPVSDIVLVIDAPRDGVLNEPVVFDASDTTGVSFASTTVFRWQFDGKEIRDGVRVEYIFPVAGKHTVELSVTDGSRSVKKKMTIVIGSETSLMEQISDDHWLISENSLVISEFLPNPKGDDTQEFIELYNSGDEPIDLSFLKLDDDDGGSHPYTIPAGTILMAHAYMVFGRDVTHLALNNSNDAVRLLQKDLQVIQSVSYSTSVEGESYALMIDGDWQWTRTPTPGSANTLTVSTGIKKNKKSGMLASILPLDELRNADVGDKVSTYGVVTVVPGVLGSQIFYIAATTTDAGVQVYMNKKQFPTVVVGDTVRVVGVVGQISGETRVKVNDKKDITVIAEGMSPIPKHIAIVDIGEQYEGQLIEVTGDVTEAKSTYWYVDDGTEEVKVYMKQGAQIHLSRVHLNDRVAVRGIVSERSGQYQLLPRSDDDILIEAMRTSSIAASSRRELGQSGVFETYVAATAAGITSLMLGVAMKARGMLVRTTLKQVGIRMLAFLKRDQLS